MKSLHGLFLAALLAPLCAQAVVVRSDVPDARYRVSASALPALAELPGEGHGVLIAPRWVVTSAHATQGYSLDHVTIDGKDRAVAELVLHPAFRKLPTGPMKGDAAPLMAAFAAMDDIALIRLTEPVTDVAPVALYTDSNEMGKTLAIYGEGATGNGKVGQYPGSPHRGELRRAENRVTRADGRWIDYRFDCDTQALPLEGVMGDGDSGGPAMLAVGGAWKLAGLTSWKHWEGDLSGFRPGICGQTFSNVRISHYATWIASVIATH